MMSTRNTRVLWLTVILLLVGMGVSCSGAARAADTETKAPPKPEQKAVVEAFRPHTVQQKAVYDDEGNVIKLAVSNHGAFWAGEDVPPPEPMPEDLFRRVLELEHLQAIGIEKQDIGDETYHMLGRLKKLQDVRLHYMSAEAGATRNAPLFINDLPLPLHVLEIKHNFKIRGGCMEKLKPQPELQKLEIDTGYAGPRAVGFIEKSPELVNLQIHRTSMTDADLQRVFKALPKLEVLLVRPVKLRQDPVTLNSLRGLKGHENLRLVILGMHWGEITYENGLDALATIPSLQQVDLEPAEPKGLTTDHPAIQKLHEARPDILIRVRRDRVGGEEDQKPMHEDSEWNWDGGVTTHG
jgi:hypothetical protein